MPAKTIEIESDEHWHRIRKRGLGGTDAGAVMGLDPWKSPLDVFNRKVHDLPPIPDNELMYWGRTLEEVVAQEFAKRTGFKVRRRNQMLHHPDRCWQLANIDREVVGKRAVLECKTANQYAAGSWGEEWTDDVPAHYLMQVVHYMSVLDYHDGYLAVLIGGNDFRMYHIKRDDELEKMLIKAEEHFWHEHVVKNCPPAPTNTRDLATIMDDGTSVEADAEILSTWAQLSSVKAEIVDLKRAERTYSENLKAFIADHSTLVDHNGQALCSFKKGKDSTKFDAARFEKDHPDLFQQYQIPKPGNRTLRMARREDA